MKIDRILCQISHQISNVQISDRTFREYKFIFLENLNLIEAIQKMVIKIYLQANSDKITQFENFVN